MNIEDLEDFPSLRQLAHSLWRVEAQRRGAALFVGAGFSRNADFAAANTPQPPIWSDLADGMVSQLYPGKSDAAPKDPLRLAEEYRAYFGQAALNANIRSQINDSAWFPSNIHKRLLYLPWADVLTTNFDTLLERAAQEITLHDYQTVRSSGDLVHARAPRIVKLHGTIGEDEQLVITEEDYRTYPTRRAAFVNLARQIFIENELCLLGFSGNDPNFLQWSGWVRDHLGGGHRRIFLVGVLGLSPATRRLLESRNVAPIDLSPLVQNVDRDKQHAFATEQLLSFLESARPIPLHAWEPKRETPEELAKHQRDATGAKARLLDALNVWRYERLKYPGWLVCPAAKRHAIRWSTDGAAYDLHLSKELLSSDELAWILVELVWRYEIALWPIPKWLVQAMEGIADSTIKCSVTERERLSLALSLLRISRQNDDEISFCRWSDVLGTINIEPDLAAELAYERCLRARDCQNLEQLEAQIDSIAGQDPIWLLRKASMHCELRQWLEAHQLVEDALKDLRRRERADRQSLWIRSRRAWAQWMSAANFMHRSENGFEQHATQDAVLHDRQSKCDPWEELEFIKNNIAEAIQKKHEEESRSIVPQFDAGVYRDNTSGKRFVSHTVVPPDHEVRRLADIVGIPVSFDHMNMMPVAIDAVALHPQQTVQWYLELIRVLQRDEHPLLDKHLSRVAVACLPQQVRVELFDRLMRAVTYWRERSQKSGESKNLIEAVTAIRNLLTALYRLATTQDCTRAHACFDLAMELGATPSLKHWWLFDSIGHLIKHSVEALPPKMHAELLLQAIEFPLSNEINIRHFEDRWPNPVEFLKTSCVNRQLDEPRWTVRIQALMRAAIQSGTERAEAVMRLNCLWRSAVLTDAETQEFAEKLWLIRDTESPALPAGTNFYKHMFSELPSPPGVDATAAVKERIFISSADVIKNTLKLTEMRNAAAREMAPLMPSHAQAVELFDVLTKSNPHDWIVQREPLQAPDDMRGIIGEVLSRVSAPCMASVELTEERAIRLLDLIECHDLVTAIPALLHFVHLSNSIRFRVVERIRTGMVGASWLEVSSAARAITSWVNNTELRTDTHSMNQLVDALVNTVEARREVGMVDVLRSALQVLKADALSFAQEERLCRALIGLIESTEYSKVEPLSRQAISVSLIRAACVRLAAILDTRPNIKHFDALADFLHNVANDPLPEVRYALE